jgi:pre-mRNA cleavage complex 2 protein Pcf11
MQDKVKINSLSMVAEDHADSRHNAGAIYQVIRQPLVSKSVPGDRKLPLVYVIDSILKNVKGKFIPVIENDAKNWLPVVHQKLSEDKRTKLKKVWNLWKDAGVFSEDSWKEMGSCFDGSSAEDSSGGAAGNSKLEKAGILGVREPHFLHRVTFSSFTITQDPIHVTNNCTLDATTEGCEFAADAKVT